MKIVCPACGNTNHSVIDKHNNYLICLCQSCNLSFCDPMHSGDLSFYQSNLVYERVDEITIAQHCRSVNNATNLQLLSLIPKGSRLLDLGCGFGAFVRFSQDQGYDAYGLDFNEEIILAGCKTLNLGSRLAVMDLKEFDAKNFGLKGFSMVTMFEVIEHLENPSKLIEEVHSILRPGGILALSCPNEARKMLTGRVFADFPPHHLTRWRPETLKRFLENKGFQHLQTKIDSKFSDWLWVAYVNYSARRKLANKLNINNLTDKSLARDRRSASISNLKISLFNIIRALCLPLNLVLKFADIGTMGMLMILRRL